MALEQAGPADNIANSKFFGSVWMNIMNRLEVAPLVWEAQNTRGSWARLSNTEACSSKALRIRLATLSLFFFCGEGVVMGF